MSQYELFPQVRRIVRSVFTLFLGPALLAGFASTSAVAQFAGPTPLTLVNGWTDAPFSTSHASVALDNYNVQFRGAISGGTLPVAFTLPTALRPARDVYIAVDLCNANKGRLHITPAGDVDVQAEGGTFSNAQCFTSLDGASFAVNSNFFANLTLINGWTGGPFSTRVPSVKQVYGKVYFKGAIATTGTNPEPFILPAQFRPTTDVYVPVDMCNSTNGRLRITPAGDVFVQTEGAFSDAACFTSLEGVWFTQNASAVPLVLMNGWTNAPFSTSTAQASNVYGVTYLEGAIATTGTNSQPFILIPRFRPITDVYVNVDLCNGNKGRLWIQTNGVVNVQAEKSFADAQCFTSLDGVSYRQ